MIEVLNGYCGIGGNRKLWKNVKVTAIDNNKEIAAIYKDLFPNDTVIVGDAHDFLLKYYKDFDFIWMSPPCPSHSKIRMCDVYKGQNEAVYPEMSLYQEIIMLKHFAKKTTNWVIESVVPYYDPLIKPQVQLGRHFIWSNFYIRKIDFANETSIKNVSSKDTRYGFNISNYFLKNRKNQILRNLVDPNIGKYIFEQSLLNKKPIFNF